MDKVKKNNNYKYKLQELTDEKSDYKYICEKCKVCTNTKSIFDVHLKSVKHKEVPRKTRSDKIDPHQCPHCEFKTKSKLGMKGHILNNHSTKKQRKEGFKFYCEKCDIGTFAQQFYNMHLKSKHHLRKVLDNDNNDKKPIPEKEA
jgi:hypothetical protein